jgi:glutathione S-transferase
MNYVHVVAVLAILQFFLFGVLVGRARKQYGVRAPATAGHELFERAFRVQMNTLEQLVAFLPALLIAALYWPNAIIASIGVVYVVGRFIYRQQYVADPTKRALGFLLTVVPTFILLAACTIGAITRYAPSGAYGAGPGNRDNFLSCSVSDSRERGES